MIYKYNKWQLNDPTNTVHWEMIFSGKILAYEWMFTEVFQSYGEFSNLISCVASICVDFEFDRHLFDKINGSILNLFWNQFLWWIIFVKEMSHI